jgi:hypothetical protein
MQGLYKSFFIFAYSIMTSPITFETPVGYIVAEDVYVSYSEYYGNGTIYGRNDLLMPDRTPVKGAGKTKAQLINANVTLSEVSVGSVTGDIVVVPNDSAPAPEEGSAPAPAPEEGSAPAPAPEEGSAPAPAPEEGSAPAPAPEEGSAPAPAPEEGCAPAPAPEEGSAPAPAPEEGSAPAPAPEEGAAPAPAPEEKVAPAPAPAPEEPANSETLDESTNNRYTVSFSVLGFKLTREFTVKIEKEARKIYLS